MQLQREVFEIWRRYLHILKRVKYAIKGMQNK